MKINKNKRIYRSTWSTTVSLIRLMEKFKIRYDWGTGNGQGVTKFCWKYKHLDGHEVEVKV